MKPIRFHSVLSISITVVLAMFNEEDFSRSVKRKLNKKVYTKGGKILLNLFDCIICECTNEILQTV